MLRPVTAFAVSPWGRVTRDRVASPRPCSRAGCGSRASDGADVRTSHRRTHRPRSSAPCRRCDSPPQQWWSKTQAEVVLPRFGMPIRLAHHPHTTGDGTEMSEWTALEYACLSETRVTAVLVANRVLHARGTEETELRKRIITAVGFALLYPFLRALLPRRTSRPQFSYSITPIIGAKTRRYSVELTASAISLFCRESLELTSAVSPWQSECSRRCRIPQDRGAAPFLTMKSHARTTSSKSTDTSTERSSSCAWKGRGVTRHCRLSVCEVRGAPRRSQRRQTRRMRLTRSRTSRPAFAPGAHSTQYPRSAAATRYSFSTGGVTH